MSDRGTNEQYVSSDIQQNSMLHRRNRITKKAQLPHPYLYYQNLKIAHISPLKVALNWQPPGLKYHVKCMRLKCHKQHNRRVRVICDISVSYTSRWSLDRRCLISVRNNKTNPFINIIWFNLYLTPFQLFSTCAVHFVLCCSLFSSRLSNDFTIILDIITAIFPLPPAMFAFFTFFRKKEKKRNYP